MWLHRLATSGDGKPDSTSDNRRQRVSKVVRFANMPAARGHTTSAPPRAIPPSLRSASLPPLRRHVATRRSARLRSQLVRSAAAWGCGLAVARPLRARVRSACSLRSAVALRAGGVSPSRASRRSLRSLASRGARARGTGPRLRQPPCHRARAAAAVATGLRCRSGLALPLAETGACAPRVERLRPPASGIAPTVRRAAATVSRCHRAWLTRPPEVSTESCAVR